MTWTIEEIGSQIGYLKSRKISGSFQTIPRHITQTEARRALHSSIQHKNNNFFTKGMARLKNEKTIGQANRVPMIVTGAIVRYINRHEKGTDQEMPGAAIGTYCFHSISLFKFYKTRHRFPLF